MRLAGHLDPIRLASSDLVPVTLKCTEMMMCYVGVCKKQASFFLGGGVQGFRASAFLGGT